LGQEETVPGPGDDHARTWAEFLAQIRKAREDLGNPTLIWYRGQTKDTYPLIPSLFRYPHGIEKEQILFNEYERSAAHLQGGKKNEWDMLNDMQHYGIPTRLLDWTDVLGIAIAFALYDSGDSGADAFDSAIYVLDPISLNSLSGLKDIKRAPSDADFGYKAVYWHGRPFYPNFPIAIDGTLHNDRLRAQNGSFTVQGRVTSPLELQAPTVIRRVVLSAPVKPEAREFLEHANLNPFSIYPDIVGMARHIVRKHLGA
jgi:hypothetical protein